MSKEIWVPLHQHSDLSLLDGFSKPKKIAERCANLGYSAAAISDHGNLAASVEFVEEMKKKNLKSILGIELYLSNQHSTIKTKENASLDHLVVLAKNLQGWKDMLKLTKESNKEENFYRKPRLSREQLVEFVHGNFISFSGHPGSQLANCLFIDQKLCYRAKTVAEAYGYLFPDALERAVKLAREYEAIFGKGNFFIEIQLIDGENLASAYVIADILREVSKITGIPCVATADSHYPTQQDAAYQRILLCSTLKTTLPKVDISIAKGDDVSLGGFFKSNKYHIPTPEEMFELHKDYPEELENSLLIASLCENYSILNKPLLPHFACPDGFDEKGYLRHWCQKGWDKKIVGKVKRPKKEYADRLEMELKTMEDVDLSAYFLIIADCVESARKRGDWCGIGRGSGGGTLIGYLTDIIGVDPVENDLLFSRFYNAGRNSPGNISLPDLDIDYMTSSRELVFEDIRNKYGRNKTGQVATFGRLMGAGALKEVLRAMEACSFDEMNKITKFIPDESKISDKLEQMREANPDEDVSILQYALENNSKDLAPWCQLKDNGELTGPFANYFKTAMKIEGTRKSMGKHASAMIICRDDLDNLVPMIHDKSGTELIVGVDHKKAEKLGVMKADVLGVKILTKFKMISDLVTSKKYA